MTQAFVGALGDLIAIGDDIFGRGHITSHDAREFVFQAVTLALFTASWKLAKSIHILLEKGQPEGAHALCRTLVEAHISMRYMAQADREERARLYVDWGPIQDEKFHRLFKRHDELKGLLTAEEIASVRCMWATIEKRHGKEKAEKMLRWTTWAEGLDMEKMAARLGFIVHYAFGHRRATEAVHLTSLADHIGPHPESMTGLGVKAFPSEQAAFEAARTAALSFACFLDHVAGVFDLDYAKHLHEIMDRIQAASVKTGAASRDVLGVKADGALDSHKT